MSLDNLSCVKKNLSKKWSCVKRNWSWEGTGQNASESVQFKSLDKIFMYCVFPPFIRTVWINCKQRVLYTPHIFPRAQVPSNKNVLNFWHRVLSEYFMPLHMVWSVLFKLLDAQKLFSDRWEFFHPNLVLKFKQFLRQHSMQKGPLVKVHEKLC